MTKESLLKEIVYNDFRNSGPSWSSDDSNFVMHVGRGVRICSAGGEEIASYFPMQGFQPAKSFWCDLSKITVVGSMRNTAQVIQLELLDKSLVLDRCINVPLVPQEIFAYYAGANFQDFKLIAHNQAGWHLWHEDSNDVTDFKAAFPRHTVAQFSPDGKYFALSGANSVEVFDSAKCRSVLILTPARFTGGMPRPQTVTVEWAPNSKTIVVLGDMYTGSVEIVPVP